MNNKVDKKILFITVALCLLPMIYGFIYYGDIPDTVAIHFDSHNQPNGWAPKWVAVLLPVPLALLQAFICITTDKRMENAEANRKMTKITKAMIPIITFVVYIITIDTALGKEVDVRKIVCVVIGLIFVVIGNYIPKTKQNIIVGVRTCQTIRDEKKWAKMNRLMGIIFIIAGLLILASVFMSPIVTAIIIGAFIVITLAVSIYASFK